MFLGAVQGLTEFLPISSSAHLAIIEKAFHWNGSNTLFDVMLHLGTLVGLLAYFWKDWSAMIQANIALSKLHDASDPAYASLKEKSMPIWPLLIACIPGGLVGMALEKKMSTIANPVLISVAMVIMAIVLAVADRSARAEGKTMEKATLKDWLLVGLAQALAIIPGVSRSGITITAGLFCGFRREAAARFSFLLGAPIILGAGLFESRHLVHMHSTDIVPMVMGILTSALVGYVAIGYLLEYLKRRSMAIFVAYRILFAVVVLGLYGAGFLR